MSLLIHIFIHYFSSVCYPSIYTSIHPFIQQSIHQQSLTSIDFSINWRDYTSFRQTKISSIYPNNDPSIQPEFIYQSINSYILPIR